MCWAWARAIPVSRIPAEVIHASVPSEYRHGAQAPGPGSSARFAGSVGQCSGVNLDLMAIQDPIAARPAHGGGRSGPAGNGATAIAPDAIATDPARIRGSDCNFQHIFNEQPSPSAAGRSPAAPYDQENRMQPFPAHNPPPADPRSELHPVTDAAAARWQRWAAALLAALSEA